MFSITHLRINWQKFAIIQHLLGFSGYNERSEGVEGGVQLYGSSKPFLRCYERGATLEFGFALDARAAWGNG